MARKGRAHILGLSICVYGLVLLMAPMPVQADIYRYVDGRGTVHFSNVPTSPKYQIYIGGGTAGRVSPESSRYDGYISEAAHKHGVPFSLIKAIIRAESDFDPRAVSRAGACGLMQIMPQTARDLGMENAFDPRENILSGVRYFAKLLSQFHGSIPLALAAYNAGPKRVGSLGKVPSIEETERFVHKVLKYVDGY